jgi:hypothetical protein
MEWKLHSQKLRAGFTVGPVLAAFIGLIPPRNAQVQPMQLKPIGGAGGGAFNDACPPRYFLTGLVLHTGDDVDAVERLCMDLHLHRPINSPKHGGSGGGNLKVLLCPPERPAIVAMDVGAEGQATFIVNNIHL